MLFWRFIDPSADVGAQMSASYNPLLVILSFLTASFAGYTALRVVERMGATTNTRMRNTWLVAGGLAMGSGIWAMHFIGMLAFSMAGAVSYDLLITFASMIPGVFASISTLWYLDRSESNFWRLNFGGFLMATGIGGMHYCGMEAMVMDSVLVYDPYLFGLSIIVAHILATIALHMNFTFARTIAHRRLVLRLGSAGVLGSAVACMHYTAMGASKFLPGESVETLSVIFDPVWMAMAIAFVSFGILGLLILATTVDRRMVENQLREERIRGLNNINQELLRSSSLDSKMKLVADGVVEIFAADFVRIWLMRSGDLCTSSCIFGEGSEVPHVCQERDRCLHLVASSSRYTHLDEEIHRRIPLGAYKVGRLISGERKFLTADLSKDPNIHDRTWAEEKGLVSCAGYCLFAADRKPIGAMALFCKHVITAEEDALMETIADTTAQVIQTTVAEEALREREKTYRQLFETVPDATIVFDAETRRIQDTNLAAQQLYGYDAGEFFNREIDSLTAEPAKVVEQVDQILEGNVNGIPFRIHEKSDGTSFPVEISDCALRIRGRDVVCLIVRDITERKQAEEAMRTASRMEATATLAGGIAHDFNNLMAVVLGNTSILRSELPKNYATSPVLKDIEASAVKAGNLAEQMLDYARGGQYLPVVMDLNEALFSVLELQRANFPPNMVVEMNFGHGLRNIQADRSQIEQVTMNLCLNAVEAMGESGCLSVSTSNEDVGDDQLDSNGDLKPGPYVVLTVTDTGCGIDEENLSRIFEPFFSTKSTGRGLGLASIYGIVKNHQGDIFVESQRGQGATFRVFFPATDQELLVVPERNDTTLSGTETVLVVDDEEVILNMVETVLRKEGYTVVTARNGQDAVNLAQDLDGSIDVIVLDMGMPVLDGPKAFPLLMKARPDAKIIVCSGYDVNGDCQLLLDNGAVAFIKKPFQLNDLLREIRQAVDLSA
jgi:PAS domain S-box-containing protein